MIWITAALALSAVLPTPARPHPPAARPAQIILFRHAEKPADPRNPHLSPVGIMRAERLVSFIATNPVMKRFGPPVAVYATQTTRDDDGQRTQETVESLAKSLKLRVLTPAHGKDFEVVAQEVLSNPAYAGKTVVICWNHEVIPELAAALGVRPMPPKWKAPVFDLVYVITYQGKRATLTTAHY